MYSNASNTCSLTYRRAAYPCHKLVSVRIGKTDDLTDYIIHNLVDVVVFMCQFESASPPTLPVRAMCEHSPSFQLVC